VGVGWLVVRIRAVVNELGVKERRAVKIVSWIDETTARTGLFSSRSCIICANRQQEIKLGGSRVFFFVGGGRM